MMPPALAVIADPEMAPAARTRVDRLRRRFDPRHRAVPPHLTLVFPKGGADRDEARRHLEATLRRVPGAIRARLSVAETIRTPGPRGWYVVLRVGSGGPALARLHARLSQGPFHGNRRGPAPYRPHLTVAAGLTAGAAWRVRRLASGPALPIRVHSAALVAWDGTRLETLLQCSFGAGGNLARPPLRPSTRGSG